MYPSPLVYRQERNKPTSLQTERVETMAKEQAKIILEINADLSTSERAEVDAFFSAGTIARSVPAMLAIMAIVALMG